MQLRPVNLMATVPPGAGGAGRFIGLWCGRGWLAERGAADWPLVVLGGGWNRGPREQDSPVEISDTHLSLQVWVVPEGPAFTGIAGAKVFIFKARLTLQL